MSDPYTESDPKTVEAIEKIKAILTEYDLWAAFTVVSETRVHWLYHFGPSWSCLYLSPTGEAHVRAKRADFATAEQHEWVINLTAGAIASTRDVATKQFADMRALYKELEKVLQITHEYHDLQYHDLLTPKKG